MLRSIQAVGFMLALLAGVSGCGRTLPGTANNANTPAIDKAKYVLSVEPDGAVGVIDAREGSKDQDDIVLVGRIGGRENPWIQGRSAFMMIDASMAVVGDGEDSAEGEVCLDDCCAESRAECTTLVKIIDEHGKPLAIDTRELLNVKENDMVVVKGKVQRGEEDSTFTIVASSVYVRR